MIARTSGSGRPIVIIHGFGVDHRIMLPLEEAIGDRPWRRIYLDLPWAEGAPTSDAASALEVASSAIEDVRSTLGETPFAIIGNSFGAMIARYVAHEMRERVLGLATLAGVFEPRHDARIVPPRQVLRVDDAVLDGAGDARSDFAEVSVVQDAASFAAFTEYVLPGLRGSDPAVIDRIATDYTLPAVPELAHPEPFTLPALHLFGRQDDVVGYEDGWRFRDHYPRGTYAVLDLAGHNVHLEQPQITTALIRDWLRRMDTHVASGDYPGS
ncbi:alpha/beta fold hydrolase [Microbacterium sp. SORGH_AS_0862]|uniref:alpha/beta fold hydrolase n=1 Tax=Microbacterium sp. SORGH_AS_0862 TaxID=3041789 RepID=UPI00278EC6E1|nr:alpha/beta hydrolase [Microbacterium sp. SORGH_AS_0862]MDQ1206238.1 pimeloyl-ACP methyl ester carboxylesterase [Microbacterium sp. SORGH_AS_0862]